MPGFDGTGPMGLGSRTGGGFGYCPPVPGARSGAAWYGVGRGGWPCGGGRGRAWGGGRGGWGRAFAWTQPRYAPPTTWAAYPGAYPGEADSIREQLVFLNQQSEALKKRLEALERGEEGNGQPPVVSGD